MLYTTALSASLSLTSFKNIHITFCGSRDGQLIARGPEPWTNTAETPQLWVQLNEKNKQTWRGWREQLKQKQLKSKNLAYLGLPVPQFSFLPGWDMFWRAGVALRDRGRAGGEAGGSSCCAALKAEGERIPKNRLQNGLLPLPGLWTKWELMSWRCL